MKFFDDIKMGEDICLVFKGQHAFIPQPDTQRQVMEMVLNVINGTFRGAPDNNRFLFETESHSGIHVIWTIDAIDVLMIGRKIEGANIARVQ